jgi:hypothetical protein
MKFAPPRPLAIEGSDGVAAREETAEKGGMPTGGLVQVLGPRGFSTFPLLAIADEVTDPASFPCTTMSMCVDPPESTQTAARWLTPLALFAQRPARFGSHDCCAYVGRACPASNSPSAAPQISARVTGNSP